VAIAKLGAIDGAGVRRRIGGVGLQQADAELPAVFVDRHRKDSSPNSPGGH
jgi:hypothetical protein